jgi:hypothetical protein
MTHAMRSGKTITIKPKMMHMMAKMGLETVTPIFFNPFSTASAKHSHFRREISNNRIFNIFSNNELKAPIRFNLRRSRVVEDPVVIARRSRLQVILCVSKLLLIEVIIHSFLFHKFSMISFLHDSPLVNDYDVIGVPDG